MATDSEDNVHAFWMGFDNMPYYSYSLNEGDTWSSPIMIAPPIGLNGTGFPVITAGSAGKVAWLTLETRVEIPGTVTSQ